MAKNYIKGAAYRLNYNSGTYDTEVWNSLKAVGDVGSNNNPDDVVVPERGMDTGHLYGENDPEITYTLYEDTGDANVEAMITALYAKTPIHLALSRGIIATAGTKFVHMEGIQFADLSANRPDPSSYQVTFKRHANSDYNMVRETTSA